jgi:hypothetical protein
LTRTPSHGHPGSDQLFKGKPVWWEDEAFLDKRCEPASVLEAVSLLVNGSISQKTVGELSGGCAVRTSRCRRCDE